MSKEDATIRMETRGPSEWLIHLCAPKELLWKLAQRLNNKKRSGLRCNWPEGVLRQAEDETQPDEAWHSAVWVQAWTWEEAHSTLWTYLIREKLVTSEQGYESQPPTRV